MGLVKYLKSPRIRPLKESNRLKGRKYCLNLHDSIFAKFFEYPEKKSAQRIPF